MMTIQLSDVEFDELLSRLNVTPKINESLQAYLNSDYELSESELQHLFEKLNIKTEVVWI